MEYTIIDDAPLFDGYLYIFAHSLYEHENVS